MGHGKTRRENDWNNYPSAYGGKSCRRFLPLAAIASSVDLLAPAIHPLAKFADTLLANTAEEIGEEFVDSLGVPVEPFAVSALQNDITENLQPHNHAQPGITQIVRMALLANLLPFILVRSLVDPQKRLHGKPLW